MNQTLYPVDKIEWCVYLVDKIECCVYALYKQDTERIGTYCNIITLFRTC